MKLPAIALLFTAGVAAGIATVVSCGDDTHKVDAATCDCAPAEPPLAGRLMWIDGAGTIPANGNGNSSASCPSNAIMAMAGQCLRDPFGGTGDAFLKESGTANDPRAWNCVFTNKTAADVTVKVRVLCLMPAT